METPFPWSAREKLRLSRLRGRPDRPAWCRDGANDQSVKCRRPEPRNKGAFDMPGRFGKVGSS